jgi:hypothetical protein
LNSHESCPLRFPRADGGQQTADGLA